MQKEKKIEMSQQEKILALESKVTALENENANLKSLLTKQIVFGKRMTEIVSEMDELLEKKKLEIESLTNQLLVKPSIDLANPISQIGFSEHQKRMKMEKDRLNKEFEKTKDGKFICPYKDICNYVTKYRGNLKIHMKFHTGEKPYRCDLCGRDFVLAQHCKKHMLTHPEMKGVQCNYCRIRFSESEIEIHQAKCRTRKQRKRKIEVSDSEL